MEDIGLGKILEHDRLRDAVHIAVIPMIAGNRLLPGTHVMLENDRAVDAVGRKRAVGIVDPFLQDLVRPGERFWLFLYPGSIRGLRHDWSHPSFPPEDRWDAKAASMDWMARYANQTGIPYEMLLERHSGDNEGFEPVAEFWHHYQVLTGKDPEEDGRYFSCAC